MSDLRVAVQTAVLAALKGSADVTALAPIFEYVPEDQQPPMVIVSKMSATPLAGKGGGLDRIELEILTVVREPGREFLTPLMAATRDAIEDREMIAAGAALSRPVFESDDDELLPDGQTYLGTQRFSLFAQPA